MKKITFLLILAFFLTQAKGSIIFMDDFESGSLKKWTIDGRQQGVSNISEIISRHGSQMAHLYHKGFSEIIMEKVFDYDQNLRFIFDMEARAIAVNPVTIADYAIAGVGFYFRNALGENLGVVRYINASSSWPFDEYNPHANVHYFSIADDAGLVSYELSAQSLLSNIEVDLGSIASVSLEFIAYTSGLYYNENRNNMHANVWVDNVEVVPEPAALSLLGIGALGLLRKKR